MLKSAFWKHWHAEPGDRFDAAGNDLAFERVEFLDGHGGEYREGNAFGNFDHAGPGERTETVEPVVPRRGVSTKVAATQSAGVRQRVFDATNTPAFLIEH